MLQICLYTRILGEIQGLVPEEFWVVSPGAFEKPEKFRTTHVVPRSAKWAKLVPAPTCSRAAR